MNQEPVKSFQSLSLLWIRFENVHIDSVLENFAAITKDVSHIEIVARVCKTKIKEIFEIVSSHLSCRKSLHIARKSVEIFFLDVFSFPFLIGLCSHVTSLTLTIIAWIIWLAIIVQSIQKYGRSVLTVFLLLLLFLFLYLFWFLLPFYLLLIYHVIALFNLFLVP